MHQEPSLFGGNNASRSVEGFWLVEFTGLLGLGRGVVTLINGKIFGGDSGFLYTGSYRQKSETLTADVHVISFAPGAHSVMGQEHSQQFDLFLTGRMAEKVIVATGAIPGTGLAFQAVLLRHGDLEA